MNPALGLVLLGAVVGGLGTLIGAGGGFLLVPVLIFLHPEAASETVTSISLAVVFMNALSGSLAYARMGRIDYRSGLLFALAAAPGAVLGALSTSLLPRRTFDAVFAVALLLTGVAMLVWPEPPPTPGDERRGRTKLGMALSSAIGYVSSLFGIGGGIIHVPMMVYVLGFPTHIATATSQFILAGMALVGTVTHVATGSFSGVIRPTLLLAAGALVGAQVGAAFSNRVPGTTLIRGLAVALGIVGVRILWSAL